MGQVKQRLEDLRTERRFTKEKIEWVQNHQPNDKIGLLILRSSLRMIETELTLLQGSLTKNPPIYVVTFYGVPQN